MNQYKDSFFQNRHAATFAAAKTILGLVREVLPPLHSAVDIGCGVGSWLAAARELGVEEILGMDGKWVNRAQLQIPQDCFIERDLDQEIDVARRFDLAISLEVAEHLAPQRAQGFVHSLTALADFVLFSAAVPGQGGTGHVNEQWQDFWLALFAGEGFTALDLVRRATWDEPAIPLWYKQNTLLYVKNERLPDLAPRVKEPGLPLRIIHPDLYTRRVITPTLGQSLKILARALKRLARR